MYPEHGGALDPGADHIGTGPTGVVGSVSTGNQVSARPPVKVQLQRGLDLQKSVVGQVGRGGVTPHDVVGDVGVDGVGVAVPRDGAEGVAFHGAGQAHGPPVEGGA